MSSDDKRRAPAAKKPLAAPRRQKRGAQSSLSFVAVPLAAMLAALAVFAVSWLVIQKGIPEPQRVVEQFRVPW